MQPERQLCRPGGAVATLPAIATMDASAPLPPLDDQTPTWDAAAALAREWELNQLANRLAAIDG